MQSYPHTGQYKVLKTLTRHGRRNSVYLIRRQNGQLAVKKQHKPGGEGAFRREVQALRELAKIDKYNVIPQLLEIGPDYFVIPYYSDTLRKDGFLYRIGFRLMPLWAVRRVFAALRHFYEHGYEIMDMYPHNILVDREHGVKFIDLEFAYPDAADPRVPFEKSQTIHGPFPGFDLPLPYGEKWSRNNYRRLWILFTGIPVLSLLYDPKWLQFTKRIVYVPVYMLICREPFRFILSGVKCIVGHCLRSTINKTQRKFW